MDVRISKAGLHSLRTESTHKIKLLSVASVFSQHLYPYFILRSKEIITEQSYIANMKQCEYHTQKEKPPLYPSTVFDGGRWENIHMLLGEMKHDVKMSSLDFHCYVFNKNATSFTLEFYVYYCIGMCDCQLWLPNVFFCKTKHICSKQY